jgi:hypothetical protein
VTITANGDAKPPRIRFTAYRDSYLTARKVWQVSSGNVVMALRLIPAKLSATIDDVRVALQGNGPPIPIKVSEGGVFVVPLNEDIAARTVLSSSTRAGRVDGEHRHPALGRATRGMSRASARSCTTPRRAGHHAVVQAAVRQRGAGTGLLRGRDGQRAAPDGWRAADCHPAHERAGRQRHQPARVLQDLRWRR